MNDISDLASLGFEDLAQADLFDLVTSTKEEPEDGDEAMSRSSVSPEPEMFTEPEPYTSITLINGEQICLRDTGGGGEDWCGGGGDSVSSDTLDLNYILAAGVVERVSSSSNLMDDLDWDPEEVSSSTGSLTVTPVPVTGGQSTIIRPRHTILASQLPLPVPARLRPSGPVKSAVVISSSSLVTSDSVNVASNNNNSLLRSALIGKQAAMVSANGSLLISGDTQTARTVLATVKVNNDLK